MSSFTLLRSLSTETQQSTPSNKQRGKLNKGFSFHQKHTNSVMLPMIRDKKSKALTRRWSSLKQYQTTTLSQVTLNIFSLMKEKINSLKYSNHWLDVVTTRHLILLPKMLHQMIKTYAILM